MEKKVNSPRAWRWPALAAGLLVIVLATMLATYSRAPSEMEAFESSIKARLGQLEGKSNDEIQQALNQVVEEGSLSISINANPVFPSGSAAGTLQIENGPQNRYGQQVVITLTDTGEQIYDSGYMPPNSHIQEDQLAVELAQGEYEATATFTAYDADFDGVVVGQAVAQLRISVLS